jgi:hypothetical protein
MKIVNGAVVNAWPIESHTVIVLPVMDVRASKSSNEEERTTRVPPMTLKLVDVDIDHAESVSPQQSIIVSKLITKFTGLFSGTEVVEMAMPVGIGFVPVEYATVKPVPVRETSEAKATENELLVVKYGPREAAMPP